jgi:hypothetical protein
MSGIEGGNSANPEVLRQGARGSALALVLALALYLPLAVLGSCHRADDVNTDTLVYARFAGYIAEGRFADTVTGCWSPLLPWSAGPLVALGMDPLYALRAVLVTSGTALVLACWLFLRRLAPLPRAWTLAAILSVALVAAYMAVSYPNPDILLAAWLWLYFTAVMDPRLMERRWLQATCGFCCGAAYLAKSYAFPFFLAHYPLTLVLRWAMRRRAASGNPGEPGPLHIRRAGSALTLGLITFGIVAGPWMGVLSAKYGRFTTTTAGTINHAVVGPGVQYGVHPVRRGMYEPQSGHIAAWETPEILPYAYWSPFASAANARHQVKIIVQNLGVVRSIFSEMDLLGLWLALFAATPVLLALSWSDREESFRTLWVGATAAVYASGFLFLFFTSRHILSVLHPLAVLWGFHAFARLRRAAGERLVDRPHAAKTAGGLILATLIVSFAFVPLWRLAGVLSDAPPYRHYRAIAEDLRAVGAEGPLASTLYREGFLVAYHLNRVLNGVPVSDDPAECRGILEDHGVRTFLVFEDSPIYRTFDDAPGWARVLTVDAWRTQYHGALKIFRRRTGANRPGGETR